MIDATPPPGDRTQPSITIWAAITTLLLASLLSAGYLVQKHQLERARTADTGADVGFGELLALGLGGTGRRGADIHLSAADHGSFLGHERAFLDSTVSRLLCTGC